MTEKAKRLVSLIPTLEGPIYFGVVFGADELEAVACAVETAGGDWLALRGGESEARHVFATAKFPTRFVRGLAAPLAGIILQGHLGVLGDEGLTLSERWAALATKT